MGACGDDGVTDTSQVWHRQRAVGLFLALAQGDRPSILTFTRDMTLEQGTLACFAVGQLLLQRLAKATGKTLEDLAAQLSLEVGSSPA